MKKISLLLLLAILLMMAACSPEVRMTGESQEPTKLLEADSSPEEFADIRKVLQRAGDCFRDLLPESFPQTDYQGVGKAARNLILLTQDKIRSYLKLARTWGRIRDMTADIMEAAGDYVADFRDASLEWWDQHKDEVENFFGRFNLDQEQLNLYKESVLEVLDDLDRGVLQETGAEWAGQIQNFVESLEIDWGNFPNLLSP